MDLVYLLAKNYDELTDPRCKKAVLEFISENTNVSEMSILFIKRLTKVADHILSSDPDSLDGLLERLFQFNNEGIDKIESDKSDEFSQNNLAVMKSHFYSYAGDTARALFEKTSLVSWAEQWYESRIQSAEISAVIDSSHSAYAYGFAGDAAKALFERTRDISWAERWYESFIHSAEIHAVIDSNSSAHAYGFAGDAAKELFKELRTELWKNRALQCYNRFLGYYSQNPDPRMDKIIRRVELDISYLRKQYGAVKIR